METHHDEQLRRYFDSLDLNYEQIRRRLGIGSRNTLASWLNHERLTPARASVPKDHSCGT
jgi:hypothetical protein